MKVVVVGSSHGGFEAVQELLQDYPQAEIQWYEKGDFLSFLSCGMQLYLEGVVKDVNSVSYATKEDMEKKGVHVFIQQDVTAINPTEHQVTVHNLADDTTRTEGYDKLIISTGAVPAQIPVAGNDLKNIYFMRGRDWAMKLKRATVEPLINKVVVIGSGYIGIEAAEAFAKAGKQVTIIDVLPRILGTYLDSEFTDVLAQELKQNNVDLALGENVKKFVGDNGKVQQVVTDKGTYAADLVIESVGVKPNTAWLADTLELNDDQTIKTDQYQRTSQPDIFAVGDATYVTFAPTGQPAKIALATNSRRQGRYAVKNLEKASQPTPAVSGSSALSVFRYHFASTGIKDATAKNYPVQSASVYVEDSYRPPFVPDTHNAKVQFKLTYNPENGQILGAQIMSTADVTANINTISLAIQQHLTVADLAYTDFFFQPGFDRPWNIMNVAAQKAQRQLQAK
ncbi:FAD-dependent oxidoreductase [Bombilactobacillus bombi]|uniref:FAD-dependent oxidoreductase n=1 Tax=Bombilactobacillus bombi TaxID=1303590 RepID=A0A417ZFS4_9LACO|nr:FAD-dependent oxidoreductase [Bombilactobacillus bombi]RHW50101.1 FAD-dependent oxidoreductase [Bombilactobacillus bombi]